MKQWVQNKEKRKNRDKSWEFRYVNGRKQEKRVGVLVDQTFFLNEMTKKKNYDKDIKVSKLNYTE